MINIGSTNFIEMEEILTNYSTFGTSSKEKQMNNADKKKWKLKNYAYNIK